MSVPTLAVRLGGDDSRKEADDFASVLKALADPSRLQVVALLFAADADGMTVVQVQEKMGLSQPTVSHHLGVLCEAGLVNKHKKGVWRFHTLDYEAIARVTADLNSLCVRPKAARSKRSN